ncbi:TDP-N-acetylfucosamine:lipid II N-acetylfucosaminyltransferase [Prevotella pallens]|uniref:TDP-N-acetylfucosamine:lipid II N-acetylfucosaminyltransferase n=1 Tax=Prevotella pallens TaxID=60133 RepID=UPI002491E8D2|nr:TDP-N-acetylfucosamine:lipid II N-acetylfucosaminyltransferase [Prevotella pallens]
MLKILNILVDDKFIDGLIEVLEFTKGEHKHDYILIGKGVIEKFQYITKTEYIKQIDNKDCLNFINNNGYDLIILHSLACIPWFKISQIDNKIKVLWKAWGFDLYRTPSEIQPFVKLRRLHPITKKYWWRNYKDKIYLNLKTWFYSQIHKKQIESAINRIDYFSGCLPNEFALMRKNSFFRAEHVELPYFHLKSNYTTENKDVFQELGHNILIGNGAVIANNHFDIFKAISTIAISDKQIIVPLSYGGDDFYIKDIIAYGNKIFGANFHPILDFMSLQEYNTLLSTCSHAILGYEQQAALGNAAELLWLGVKLFLPQTSVNYKYFRDNGYKVFTIENDLTEEQVSQPLTSSEKLQNREAFLKTMSVDINLEKINKIYKVIEKDS